MCILSFPTNLSEIFLILRRIQQCITINVLWSSLKAAVILVRNQIKLNFLYRFSKNTRISNFIKICPVGAEMFQPDGET